MERRKFMNPRITKLKEERARLAQRRESIDVRIQKLEEQIMKLENTDIIGIVRETGVTIDELAGIMKTLENNHTAAITNVFGDTEDGDTDEKPETICR